MVAPRLERYIEDTLARPLPALTARDLSLPTVSNKANVIIGMRRSGKTYFAFQEMKRLIASGVDRRHILYVNFEDDRLAPLELTDLDVLLETFYRSSPTARSSGAYLFFDEVQAVENWSRFARRVLDTEQARILIAGSSAKMLSTEVSTEFRGRGLAIELLPFSFAETVRHGGVDLPSHPPGAALRSRLESLLLKFIEVGGFPEAQQYEQQVRIGILQDYVELVLMRDVIERHGITNAHVARIYARALLQNSGRTFAVNKAYNDFKSRGISVSKDTLYALLSHFSDAFLVFSVPLFSKSLRVRETNPRKIYAIDSGLAFALSHIGAFDLGARLETVVYLELRRRCGRGRDGSVSYYSTKDGFEVDFVVGEPDDEHAMSLVQVCADMSQPETRTRELRALVCAMKELGLAEATIVSLDEEEIVKTDAGNVRIVPAWRWLLGW